VHCMHTQCRGQAQLREGARGRRLHIVRSVIWHKDVCVCVCVCVSVVGPSVGV
jgi:hypothetical protein